MGSLPTSPCSAPTALLPCPLHPVFAVGALTKLPLHFLPPPDTSTIPALAQPVGSFPPLFQKDSCPEWGKQSWEEGKGSAREVKRDSPSFPQQPTPTRQTLKQSAPPALGASGPPDSQPLNQPFFFAFFTFACPELKSTLGQQRRPPRSCPLLVPALASLPCLLILHSSLPTSF